jgi:hypothetical protein
MALSYDTEYVIYRLVRREDAVENAELTLQTGRNVVTTAT